MTTITINRDVFAQHIQGLIEVMRMPNSEHVADAHNKAVRFLRAALAAQPSHTEAQRGEPALWRYRDSEQCIKPMDGYTPGEGWTPLYAAPQPERKHTEAEVQELMEFARHYAADTFSSATLEDKIRRSLAASATAPAWYDAQQAEIESLRWTVKDALESLDNGMTADCRATLSSATKETP